MASFDGVATPGLSGVINFTGIGFQPTTLKLVMCAKNGINTSAAQLAEGTGDFNGVQRYWSVFADASGALSKQNINHILQQYERVSGTITKVFEADFVSLDPDGFTLDVTMANANYTMYVYCTDV